jgi:SAM-dependent methyltransferase
MNTREIEMKSLWDTSFKDQVNASSQNTAPVESIVRTAAYYMRARYKPEEYDKLHFLEMGCGAGPNLIWLADKNVKISGVDVSPVALKLARENIQRHGLENRLENLLEGSVTKINLPGESFDGIIESCVFQHLDAEERKATFNEVHRLLKPGGVFIGHMLSDAHTVYKTNQENELSHDPGTLQLSDPNDTSKLHLTNIGLSHFFRRSDFDDLLSNFSVIDPCESIYYYPKEEALRRGYDNYCQGMWIVYAIK